MKVVICSLAGNAGKTTMATHLLHPRMPLASIYAVDTTNATAAHFGLEVEAYGGDEFTKLYKQIVQNQNVIIDVGGSKEGKEFLAGMDWMEGHDEIDAFIVPSMSEDKDQKAAFKTIELLLAQGVDKSKIKVIFNGVKKYTIDEFDYLLGALAVHEIPFSLDATVFRHDLFDILSVCGRSLDSILNDTNNYKQLVQKSTDASEIAQLLELMIAQKSAPKVNENLDTVFNALFPARIPKQKSESKRAEVEA